LREALTVLHEPSFTVGIEEEYLLVDPVTRDLVVDKGPAVVEECEALLRDHASPEFLRAQVEVQTEVCKTIAEARANLTRLRRTVAEVGTRHGVRPIAVATHPFAAWQEQRHTDKERYNELAQSMQVVARRLLICGLHVHVGIEDDELRIDLMSQVAYFLPHLLALSTSSPFWQGQQTGLMSYRMAVFDELPRTGLPEQFDSWGEYQRHISVMIAAGLIDDASKIWWDVRPSAKFPTLEMRIADMCSRRDDAVCIAAIYLCVLRMLYRLRRDNQRWRRYANMLVNENRWRAQRYGLNDTLVDFGKGALVPYADLLEEILALIAEDAEHLGCTAEVQHARRIVAEGTSAHRQIAAYAASRAAGANENEALQAVVDTLVGEFTHGLDTGPGA
jgi:carboxylate-amine ligase